MSDGWGTEVGLLSLAVSASALLVAFLALRATQRNRDADYLQSLFTSDVVTPVRTALDAMLDARRRLHGSLTLNAEGPTGEAVAMGIQEIVTAVQELERVLDAAACTGYKEFVDQWQNKLESMQREVIGKVALLATNLQALSIQQRREEAVRGLEILNQFSSDLMIAIAQHRSLLHKGKRNRTLRR